MERTGRLFTYIHTEIALSDFDAIVVLKGKLKRL